MHNKKVFITIILIMLLALPLVIIAQPQKDVKIMMKKGAPMDRIEREDDNDTPDFSVFDKLNLTEDQEKDFGKMRMDLQKKQIAVRAKIQTAQIEMKELWSSENPDRNAIEKKIKEIADLKSTIQLNRLDHWFAVSKILKPEQMKIWKKHFNRGPKFSQMRSGRPFEPKMKMRIRKEINECIPDCPNADPRGN
jgi:Spy/CpxP family protein refolding chaperone